MVSKTQRVDLTGRKIGHVRVLEFEGGTGMTARWLVECVHCGKKKSILGSNLRRNSEKVGVKCSCKLWHTGTMLNVDSAFVLKYTPLVKAVTYRVLNSRADYAQWVDDVVQRTFLSLSTVKRNQPVSEHAIRSTVAAFAENEARRCWWLQRDQLHVPRLSSDDEPDRPAYDLLLDGITDGTFENAPYTYFCFRAAFDMLPERMRQFAIQYVRKSGHPSGTERMKMCTLRKELRRLLQAQQVSESRVEEAHAEVHAQ